VAIRFKGRLDGNKESKQLVLETTNISENFTMYFFFRPVLAKPIGEQ
jgi:hypothetical protein